MARKKTDAGEDPALNMTPMIDCVFQLIIFFMICSRITDSEMEVLTLPEASKALPDTGEEKRIVVNVQPPDRDGACTVRVRGKAMTMPALARFLRLESLPYLEAEPPHACWRPVLIRADRNAPFKFVQAVLQECARAKLYKIQIACREPKGGEEDDQ